MSVVHSILDYTDSADRHVSGLRNLQVSYAEFLEALDTLNEGVLKRDFWSLKRKVLDLGDEFAAQNRRLDDIEYKMDFQTELLSRIAKSLDVPTDDLATPVRLDNRSEKIRNTLIPLSPVNSNGKAAHDEVEELADVLKDVEKTGEFDTMSVTGDIQYH